MVPRWSDEHRLGRTCCRGGKGNHRLDEEEEVRSRWDNATGSTNEKRRGGSTPPAQRDGTTRWINATGSTEWRRIVEVSRGNSVKGLHNLREIRWDVPSVAVVVCM